jgi:acyl-CoA thioesterase-1
MKKKRIMLGLIPLLVLAVGFEAYNLLRLKHSLVSYATYWDERKADPGQVTYLALGDSAAQSIGASSPERGYVGILASRIQQTTGKTVRVINLSVSGARVGDIMRKQIPQLKNYKPDYVTLDVGANDVNHNDLPIFSGQYQALLDALPKGTIVGNVPYFGGRIRKNGDALKANVVIAKETSSRNIALADLQTVTRDRQNLLNYASDLFHPSNRGYQNWADAYWTVLRPRL